MDSADQHSFATATATATAPDPLDPGPHSRRSPAGSVQVDRRRAARRDLALFFALVAVLSAPWEVAISLTHALQDTSGIFLVAPLMWMPALSAMLTRLITRQPLRGESRGRGRQMWRWLLLPPAVAAPAYAIAIATGLVDLDPPPPLTWLVLVLVGIGVNVVVVPGEEIGWRGFMLPRLVQAEVRLPLVANGVIWATWHLPLVLWGGLVADGPPPWVSAVVFLLVLGPVLGGAHGWLRLRTGSTWPPIALHVAWNVTFQNVFEVAVQGPQEGLWVGELGVLTQVTAVVAVLVAIRVSARANPIRNREASPSPGL